MARLIVHLRDAVTNAPIIFTAVFVGASTAVSGMNGDAVFELSPGSYSLNVRSPMYVAVPGSPQTVTVPSEVTVQMARVTL